MNNLLNNLYQKLQDLTNRLDLLKQQFDSFVPILEDDENLSSLVASLQQNVSDFQLDLTSAESNINALNNTCSTLLTSVENNNNSIQNLQNKDAQFEQQLNTLNSADQELSSSIDYLTTVLMNFNNISHGKKRF